MVLCLWDSHPAPAQTRGCSRPDGSPGIHQPSDEFYTQVTTGYRVSMLTSPPSCVPVVYGSSCHSSQHFLHLYIQRIPVWRQNRNFLCKGHTTPASISMRDKKIVHHSHFLIQYFVLGSECLSCGLGVNCIP